MQVSTKVICRTTLLSVAKAMESEGRPRKKQNGDRPTDDGYRRSLPALVSATAVDSYTKRLVTEAIIAEWNKRWPYWGGVLSKRAGGKPMKTLVLIDADEYDTRELVRCCRAAAKRLIKA